jgi:hypothetical protein
MLVDYEMQWTVRYFLNESNTWKNRSLNHQCSPGASAYAARQNAIWYRRAAAAENDFRNVNKRYKVIVTGLV